MKNNILKSLVLIFLVISLSACSNTNPIEENIFNVNFSEMNFKENTADFVVYGYPNENEKEQIVQIIQDSLKDQNVSESTTVNLYSDLQDSSQEPFFGTVEYKDGKVQSDIKLPEEKEYIEIATS